MAPKNFNQALLNNFSGYADLPAMMFKKGGSCRTITYQALEDICLRVAAGLMEIVTDKSPLPLGERG